MTSLMTKTGALGRGVGFIIDGLLVIGLAWAVAAVGWSVLSPGHSVASTTGGPVFVGTTTPRLSADPGILARFDPFFREVDFSVSLPDEDAPETTLNLTIKTLRVSSGGTPSGARILRPGDNVPAEFREGELILDDVRLMRILSDRIIIDNRGETQILFQRDRAAGVLTRVDGAIPQSVRPQALGTPFEPGRSPGVPGAATTTGQVKDLNALYLAAAFRPVMVDGQLSGFRVTGASSDALAASGLRQGDVVKRLNSFDLGSDSPGDVYDALKDETALDMVLERDGQILTVSVMLGEEP